MGLDVHVFLNKQHLPFDADELGAEFDQETGEYFFYDIELDRKYSLEARMACHKRIGNIAAVAELRDEAGRVLDEASVVVSKVLYSGTHSGDCLKSEVFADLEQELALLRSASHVSESMQEFVRDMEELMSAAKAEGNPIVF
jgi:hypothetical protein